MDRTDGMKARQCLALGMLLTLPMGARAWGESDLKPNMATLANQIQKETEKYGNAIMMGEFTGPPGLASSGGPGIAQSLKAELESLGVAVTRTAQIAVKGEYRIATDEISKKTAMAIIARLTDRNGKDLLELRPLGVFDLATIAGVTGVTMVAPVNKTLKEREAAVDQALSKIQRPAKNGTLIQASDHSLYGVEIMVGPDPGAAPPDLRNYRPRAASIEEDNLAFVNIARGDVYAVRIINNSKFDAAATVTIDGLNMFAFSANTAYEFVVVPAGCDGVVVGWHRNNEVSDAFQVSEYSKSAAFKQMPNSSSIGTIHVSFKAAWAKGTPAPEDEFPPGGPRARDANATARGAEVRAQYTEVVREYGKLREAVSVRYNKEVEPADLPAERKAGR
jgi:hypothetical protein